MNIDKIYLQKVLSKYPFASQISDYFVMAEGKENTSVKIVLENGKMYLLRFWGQTHSYMGVRKQQDIEAELDFMQHCYDQGIEVPKLYKSTGGSSYDKTSDGVYYAVMDYVTGEMPSNATPAMIRQVAHTMARMHRLAKTYRFPADRSWPGSVIEVAQERLVLLQHMSVASEHKEFIQPMYVSFMKALESSDLAELPRGPIHGDIFWENMKFQNGVLQGIYDFDDCRDSFFLEDITKTLTIDLDDTEHGFFGAQGENIQIFIEAYESIRPLTTNEKQLFPLFLTASFLSRLARYLSKEQNSILVYIDRVTGYCEQYRQNQHYFLPVEKV